MKPLVTKYKLHKFRSRLEARWAVFFDMLKIKWEYEPEGYDLGDGVWYLPDFYLPDFYGGIFVEVKHHGGDMTKAYLFARKVEKPIWFCEGPPDVRTYTVLSPVPGKDTFEKLSGIPLWDQAWDENRFFIEPGYEDENGFIDEDYWAGNEEYIHAVETANNYNFKS